MTLLSHHCCRGTAQLHSHCYRTTLLPHRVADCCPVRWCYQATAMLPQSTAGPCKVSTPHCIAGGSAARVHLMAVHTRPIVHTHTIVHIQGWTNKLSFHLLQLFIDSLCIHVIIIISHRLMLDHRIACCVNAKMQSCIVEGGEQACVQTCYYINKYVMDHFDSMPMFNE